MLAGQLGTVRVGMDKTVITAAAAQAGSTLLLTFGGFAVEAPCLHEILDRLLEVPPAGMKVYIHVDARGTIATESEYLTLRRGLIGI